MDTDVTVATCQLDSSTPMSAKRVRPMDNVVQFFQPICQFTDLDPSTEHKVVVEYVTGGRLNLDYMTYTPTESSGAVSVFVDDGDEGIVYTTPSGEEWVEDLLQGAVGGSRHSSGEVGAKATFHFNGVYLPSKMHTVCLDADILSLRDERPRLRLPPTRPRSLHLPLLHRLRHPKNPLLLTLQLLLASRSLRLWTVRRHGTYPDDRSRKRPGASGLHPLPVKSSASRRLEYQ